MSDIKFAAMSELLTQMTARQKSIYCNLVRMFRSQVWKGPFPWAVSIKAVMVQAGCSEELAWELSLIRDRVDPDEVDGDRPIGCDASTDEEWKWIGKWKAVEVTEESDRPIDSP